MTGWFIIWFLLGVASTLSIELIIAIIPRKSESDRKLQRKKAKIARAEDAQYSYYRMARFDD